MAQQHPRRSIAGKNVVSHERQQPSTRKIVTKVDELSPDAQHTVRDMLVNGFTFEDVVEVVNDLGEDMIEVRAVEKYFRSDLNVQTDRIRRQLETARTLKQALKDPDSGQAELAEAVLITGLMGLRKHDEASKLQRAFRVKDQQENQQLKKDTYRLKAKKFELDKKVLDARLRSEVAKRELLQAKVFQLKQAVDRESHDHVLGPETIQRIQEIYGLVSNSEPGGAAQNKINAQG
ncbi:MAG TPA: hypothetical protein VKV79_03225 [Terriglobia bacterium]|nr:hypothetical protein [Terriglobia bacterium]